MEILNEKLRYIYEKTKNLCNEDYLLGDTDHLYYCENCPLNKLKCDSFEEFKESLLGE